MFYKKHKSEHDGGFLFTVIKNTKFNIHANSEVLKMKKHM